MTNLSLRFSGATGATTWASEDVYPNIRITGQQYPTVFGSTSAGWSLSISTKEFDENHDPRVSGSNAISATGRLRVDLPDGPGEYRIKAGFNMLWLALSNSAMSIRDGDGAGGAPGTVFTNIVIPAVAARRIVDVNGVDMSPTEWLLSDIAYTGLAASGGTNTIVLDSSYSGDPLHKWIYISNGTSVGESKRVIAYNSSTKTATLHSAWTTIPDATSEYNICNGGGNYITINTTSDHIFLERASGSTYVNYFEIENVPAPLSDAIITSEDGITPIVTSGVYTKEPPGKKFGRIYSPSGTQNFTILSSLPFLDMTTIDGSPWLITNTTPIPDTWDGEISVRQTDGSTTHDTTIIAPVYAVGERLLDNSILGKLSSETLVNRNEIRAVTVTEAWDGYQDQVIDPSRSFTAASDTEFKSIYDSITPDGVSWYEIKLQEGSWSNDIGADVGGLNFNSQKDFGTGGLYVHPDVGHDPIIYTNFYAMRTNGMEWRDTIFSPTGAASFQDSLGYSVTKYLKAIFRNNRIGGNYGGITDYNNWNSFIFSDFVEGVQLINNKVDGLWSFALISGGRYMVSRGNDISNLISDFHRFSNAYRADTPRGIFADDDTYCEISYNRIFRNPDIYEGLTGAVTPHSDFLQRGRFLGTYYVFAANPNGNASIPWVVGYGTIDLSTNRRYEVISITTGTADINTPPTGTDPSGIWSGGVEFGYVGDYTTRSNMSVLFENNVIHIDGISVNLDGNASPIVQYFIDSNSGFGCPCKIVCINELVASGSGNGLGGGEDCEMHVENVSFVGPARRAVNGTAVALLAAGVYGNRVRVRNSIVGYSNTLAGARITGLESKYTENNIVINWGVDTVTRRPTEYLRGTFYQRSDNSWAYDLDQGLDYETVASNLSKLMHTTNGNIGARAKEIHTKVGSGGANITLIVEP